MKRVLFSIFVVMLTVQGCSNNHSLKEDIKDVGQDVKNEFNKATD
jgi:predicted small secreted protein